jgi:hypothetical protein
MKPKLPPPDPNEPFVLPPDETPLGAPTAVFLGARQASAEDDRIADALLDVRPGLLIVLQPGV